MMWSIAEQLTWLWLVIQAVLILSLMSHGVIHKESSRKPIGYMAPRNNGDKMRGVSAGRSDLVDAHSWLTVQRQRAKYGGILLK